MPKIEKEIFLNCSPDQAFKKMSKFDFIKRINSTTNVDTNILFHNGRIIRYSITVNGVGSWESERILIPESNIIVTYRRSPLSPFKYMVVLYALKEYGHGTKVTYVEEFEVEDRNIHLEEKILKDILKRVDPILKNIADYFSLAL